MLVILGNTRLENGIKKLFSNAQTSCLKGFHAAPNQGHPKLLCLFMHGEILQVWALNIEGKSVMIFGTLLNVV